MFLLYSLPSPLELVPALYGRVRKGSESGGEAADSLVCLFDNLQ